MNGSTYQPTLIHNHHGHEKAQGSEEDRKESCQEDSKEGGKEDCTQGSEEGRQEDCSQGG